MFTQAAKELCYETRRANWRTEFGEPRGNGGPAVDLLSAVGNGYSRWRLDDNRAQVMDHFGEENRTRNCPRGRTIYLTKHTLRWPTALCVGYCGQGILS